MKTIVKYLIAFFLLFTLWHSDAFATTRGALLYFTASAKQAVTQTVSALQSVTSGIAG